MRDFVAWWPKYQFLSGSDLEAWSRITWWEVRAPRGGVWRQWAHCLVPVVATGTRAAAFTAIGGLFAARCRFPFPGCFTARVTALRRIGVLLPAAVFHNLTHPLCPNYDPPALILTPSPPRAPMMRGGCGS